MILYFTGTGNSRFVAERIAGATKDETVDTSGYIRKGESAVFTAPGRYVFVCPVYVSAPPKAFMEFIRRSVFPSDCRAYFIMVCAGAMSGSPKFCRLLAAEKGFTYLGTAQVVMPQNYLVYFKNRAHEENREIIQAALPVIDRLSTLTGTDRTLPDPGMKNWEYTAAVMILDAYYRFFMSAEPFMATERCVGCEKCAANCPLGNIVMKDRRPVWGANCTHCMACINLCPKEAIEYGKRTQGKLRYHGPDC